MLLREMLEMNWLGLEKAKPERSCYDDGSMHGGSFIRYGKSMD